MAQVFDVVVVGSGGGGLSAAITAAKRGLEVLLIEKTEYFGGATALSGGGTWIPANSLARNQGIEDSIDDARTYVEKVVGETLRKDVLDAFLENAPAMLDYMLAETEVNFYVAPFSPDYHPDEPGASQDGRLLSPTAFDGRKLGQYFDKLRPPLAEFNAPGGMMIDLSDMEHVLDPTKSFKSAWHVTKMVAGAAKDRLSGYSRGTRLAMGNALAGRLLRSALDAGVTLWNETGMIGFDKDENGRIVGVHVERNGQKMTIGTRRGAVLASGGFSQNPEMRKQHIPYAEHHISLMPPGNTGDGIRAAMDAGAAMDEGNIQNAAWTVISLVATSVPRSAQARLHHRQQAGKAVRRRGIAELCRNDAPRWRCPGTFAVRCGGNQEIRPWRCLAPRPAPGPAEENGLYHRSAHCARTGRKDRLRSRRA